jgi:hypothetical protein
VTEYMNKSGFGNLCAGKCLNVHELICVNECGCVNVCAGRFMNAFKVYV